ncbi:MAG: ISAs1 family transposase [Roseateles sp.]
MASHDTFSRVFALLDAKRFEACFIAWMSRLCPDLQSQAIHIDGKSVRGSHDADGAMAHLVSAWDSASGVTLGQIRTADKRNEIKAIPQLLELLDVRGATVTIDAMGCQREVVARLMACGADYIIAVKNNPPNLAQAVEALFSHEAEGLRQGRLLQDTTVDKGHGRIETRRCLVSATHTLDPALTDAWPGLRSAVMVCAQREPTSGVHKGQASTEWRYYISSLSPEQLDAAGFNQRIRAHWSIENQCHWVLDVLFGEDDSRVRVDDGAENLAIVRRMALGLINQNKPLKGSRKSKRHLAAWSTTHLQTLLGLQAQPAVAVSAGSP